MTNNKLQNIIETLKNVQNELLNIKGKDLRKIALQTKGLLPSEVEVLLENGANEIGSTIYKLEKINN